MSPPVTWVRSSVRRSRGPKYPTFQRVLAATTLWSAALTILATTQKFSAGPRPAFRMFTVRAHAHPSGRGVSGYTLTFPTCRSGS